MCTSRGRLLRSWGPSAVTGFSLVELIVGLALAMCVAVAAAPSWLALESTGASEADRTVCLLQGRVAVARLERELRLASAAGCPFAVTGPVLEASVSQLVFLERSPGSSVPLVVEWEIAGRSLMRRWGPCPAARPLAFAHSLYRDNKTMLEGVRSGSVFEYVVRGSVGAGPVCASDLASIEAVVVRLEAGGAGARGPVETAATARVGR
jgi:Tfp pilus assembly protein PilW